MARPRLPLTEFEREKLRPVDRWALGVLALGVALTALAAINGHTRIAVLGLVMTAAYCLGVLSIRLRTLWLTALLLSIAPLAGGYLVGHPVIGALIGVAFFGWLAISAGRWSIDAESVRLLESPEVDPEAAGHVAAFEELGFEPVGALSFEPTPGKTVIETVMIGPQRDAYAAVTDLVFEVVSSFGSQLLVTRNSAHGTLLPECLGNDLRGADPHELVAAHQRGLEILAARGLRPDPIETERLLESHIDFERRSIEWALAGYGRRLTQVFLRSGTGSGPLDERSQTQRRIDAWLGLAPS